LNALSSTAFEKRTSLLLGITVLIHIVLNFILIPKYGFNGVAASMVIAESFFFISGMAATNKRLYKIGLLRIVSKPLIASIIMSVFILLFKQLPFFAIIFFSAIIYFAALLALRAFN
jgi:O-antigen/teichoic acid export membrane protein